MSAPSTSSSALRTLRTSALLRSTVAPSRFASSSSQQEPTFDPYRPAYSSSTTSAPSRPPRPTTPHFFSGRPQYTAELTSLTTLLSTSQSALRQAHLFPLPPTLTPPPLPAGRWVSPDVMSGFFGRNLNNSKHARITALLTELERLRQLAELGGKPEVAQRVADALRKYRQATPGDEGGASAAPKVKKVYGWVDELGRGHANGRRKTSSARVWIVPSQAARDNLDKAEADSSSAADLKVGEVLVNHLPLASHFPRPVDREHLLRPLRITGLLGAFNVFALVKGGGLTGQAGAISLALARALRALRPETEPVLLTDNALHRDTRMVERKKTNMAKARKGYTWVKR